MATKITILREEHKPEYNPSLCTPSFSLYCCKTKQIKFNAKQHSVNLEEEITLEAQQYKTISKLNRKPNLNKTQIKKSHGVSDM